MRRIVEAVVPARLGRSFRWLIASSWITNLADGIALAAGPLLVASQTRDPRLVAAALVVQRLPMVLFGLYAGVLADRIDRRKLMMVVDGARAVVLVVLAAAILTDAVNVAVVLGALFLLGVAETFADTVAGTLLPMLVDRSDLGIANARLLGGFVVANQLVGPPVGAALFTLGLAVPFTAQAILITAGVVLVGRIGATPVPERETAPTHALRDALDGLRWLRRNPPVRTLTLTIVSFNVTFGAAWSVLVLYATDHLGLGEVGFGVVTAVGAAGGILGAMVYGWLERRFRLADIMRVGLLVETLTHLSLASTSTPWVAMVVLFAFGIHTFVWGATSTSIRQRAVPDEFQGRVGAIYMIGVQGGLVLGAALGGPVAQRWGITAPFWFGFVGSAVILVAIWRQLAHIAHAGDPQPPASAG